MQTEPVDTMISLPPKSNRRRLDHGIDATAQRDEDPTPEQIAELCREIRSTWSSAERQRRSVGAEVRPRPAEVQVIATADLPLSPELAW